MHHEFKNIRMNGKLYESYINDRGIYAPVVVDNKVYYQCIVPKIMFVEAYNQWIKGAGNTFIGQDDADDWSED